jgi:hypothetical protein
MRCHPETRADQARRTAPGKTHRDIGRCIKRAIARRSTASWSPRPARAPLDNIGASNGLLRQTSPSSADLGQLDQAALDAIAAKLNGRPRQTLGFKTPSQALAEALR